ncbi:DUF1015 domain-containing protein [Echinicola salinicaeni]|uniref:DUF1015 domain-containing protein n=1 Tax=Echinicola salinicaeni TaxID=2762757 RepID=UPI0016495E73|nr:DUF1015 domain-containing protein [Echinicola salinicaeni]
MAEILPLRAWRYSDKLNIPMEELVSPLFDVAKPDQLKKLYLKPYNSIHLTLPGKELEGTEPSKVLNAWKIKEIILQDEEPGIYVYYQFFKLQNSHKEYCRKGFIAQIKAYDWKEKAILRHEDTIASSVEDRIKILRETQIQSSPTHGLYHDDSFQLESYMDEAIQTPLYDIEDYQGVREVLTRITDHKIISKFINLIDSKSIILADGHHRLQAAIEYKNLCKSQNPNHDGTEAYNYHMMYFSNSSSDNIKILPTHRLFKNLNLNKEDLLNQAKKYFNISKLNKYEDANVELIKSKWQYILITKNSAYHLTFKTELFHEFANSIPQIVKELDLSVLHFFFVEKVLGIPLEQQRFSGSIEYESNVKICQEKLNTNEVNLAILTRALKMDEILNVCDSGYTLPQKSTYFYPKLLSGLLFGSIREKEFKLPYHNFQ